MKGTSVNTTPFWKQISIKFCIYLTGFEGFTVAISCLSLSSIFVGQKTELVSKLSLSCLHGSLPYHKFQCKRAAKISFPLLHNVHMFQVLTPQPMARIHFDILTILDSSFPIAKECSLGFFFPEQYPAKRSTLFVVRSSKVKGGNGISLNTLQQSVLGNLTMKTIGPY